MKVATYNIAGGAGYSGYKVTTDYKLIAEDIVKNGVEIAGLQEVDYCTRRNNGQNTVGSITSFCGYYGFFAKATNMDGGTYGNALISKYPIMKAESIRVPYRTEKEEKRCVLHAVVDVNGEPLNVFVTHSDQGSIVLQLNAIWEIAKKCEKFVLLGDFNYTDRATDSAFAVFENCKMANTYSNPIVTTFDGYKFDNIIVSDSIGLDGIETVDTGHSDHMMLKADIEI